MMIRDTQRNNLETGIGAPGFVGGRGRFVLVHSSCCNKCHELGALETIEIYFLLFWKPEV